MVKTKRGIGTVALVIIVVLIIAAVYVIMQNYSLPTGKASVTPGAHYGPIESGFNVYTECIYLTADDGWDVTRKGKVKYFNRLRGVNEEIEDHCSGTESVREIHCDEGYRKSRLVNCPDGTSCTDGVCVE